RDVEKVLRSAVANAESRPDLYWSGDDLEIVSAFVDEGPTLKRHRARARGRVGPIKKRTCHITIELVQSEAAVAAAASAAPATRPGRRRTARTEEPALETAEAAEAATDESPESTAEAPLAAQPEAAQQEEES